MNDSKTEKDAPPSPASADTYSGMRELHFSLTPSVLLCGAGGAILGAILSLWATQDFGIVAATVVVMGILSGLFGMFL
ncbi:MAG: hypothetical protein WB816_12935 [Methylocystis sp.]